MGYDRQQTKWSVCAAIVVAVMVQGAVATAAQLRDVCEIQGARGNMLKGIGIVVGLAATGDKAPAAIVAQQRALQRLDIDVDSIKELKSDNAAVVMVTATMPAFAKEGTRIDVKLDSLYDAESLEGGTLLETHLRGPGTSETVYAVAQGPVSVGGFNADASGGNSVRQNHVTGGRIPMGAYVEREVPSTITDGHRLVLLLKQPSFETAANIQQALNIAFGSGSGEALGAGSVMVSIPETAQGDLVGFIDRVLGLTVETDQPTRVVINERTGTIVVGGEVIIKPCHVAHGGLTIEIATTPQVTQPLPFTDAEPIVTETVDLQVEQTEAFLMPVQGTSAGEVAQALNRLRVTPRDMISIFQALREGGFLEADLEIM